MKYINAVLAKKYFFLGDRKDVNDILCAADLFILPSIYEGLGIVLIEAQVSGLHCIISDRIPEEVDMGIGLITRKSLSEKVSSWAKSILDFRNQNTNRELVILNSLVDKYDIKNIAQRMEDFYISNAEDI
jgi:glycosyltransferase involved in cell wall biosynthesis